MIAPSDSPLWARLHIPSSKADHFESAAGEIDSWFPWPQGHPAQAWVAAAREMAACMRSGRFPCDPTKAFDDDIEALAFVERVAMPAFRTCQLARTRRELNRLDGAVEAEVATLPNPGDFFHGAHMLHLATGLAEVLGTEVTIVATVEGAKRPDFELRSLNVAVEAKVRERGDARQTTTTNFAKADAQMRAFALERPGVHGILALDLGFCASPTIARVGKFGPQLDSLIPDVDANYADEGHLEAVLLTVQTVEYHEASHRLVPSEPTLLRYGPAAKWREPALDQCFFTAPGDRVAYCRCRS